MIEIRVRLPGRGYPVRIGRGALAALRAAVAELRGRRIAIVSDAAVWALHGPRLESALRRLRPMPPLLIGAGERHKSWATLRALCDGFLARGLGRDGVVVAFGGGVVGDAAGLAASVYMRGVDWIQVPTTLLAMVDSSVGGKVAINHPGAKNLVGAFHQPRAVFADTSLLATLPPRELQSGAYEILKCSLLGDPALFRRLAALAGHPGGWSTDALVDAIAAACRVKARIVAQDEREGGLRRVLNLGHTLGHALEAVAGYRRFTHGEAVGWGLLAVVEIAERRGLLKKRVADRVRVAVDRLGPRPSLQGLSEPRLVAALARDKKAKAGRVAFVLPAGIGRVVLRSDVSRSELRRALRALTPGFGRAARQGGRRRPSAG